MDENLGGHFKVDRLGRVDQQLRDLFMRAKKRGSEAEFRDVLKRVIALFREAPLTRGDPLHRTAIEGGMIFRGICGPLLVNYAAFEKERIVMLFDIMAFPGRGFDS